MNKGRKILQQYLEHIPNKTGVYRYFNEKDEIIYVGKAVDLHKRISSYLDEEKITPKTKKLVGNIAKVEFTIVDSEQDAFLLENNLIKKYQPFYNILLKDGKSYPKIIITDEIYPRVFPVRDITKVKGEVFGPYSSKKYVDFILDTIRKIYPIRTCKYDFSQKRNVKVCLKYHIGKCCGICENKISAETYNMWIRQIRALIKGDIQNIISDLKNEMRDYSCNLYYEKAQQVKNNIQILLNFKSRSVITNTAVDNVDVFGFKENKREAYITILHINCGSITQVKTIEYRINVEEPPSYILAMAIKDSREMLHSDAKTVIVPFMPEITDGLQCREPKNNTEKELLLLANKNVEEYYLDKLRQEDKRNPEQKYDRILYKFSQYLKLNKCPYIIDSFDVSHIQGSNAVGSCVTFKKGVPFKSSYQKFIIKNIAGNDDYHNTKEIVERRYANVKEGTLLPDLIIADGGETQMRAIDDVVNKKLNLNIEIIGLKKNKKHVTNKIIYGFPQKEVDIPITDELFHFLTKIQNEVHRFAISFHKDKRSVEQSKSKLDSFYGIGPKTKEKLLLTFKSIENIKRVSMDELVRIIGKEKAKIIYEEYHGQEYV